MNSMNICEFRVEEKCVKKKETFKNPEEKSPNINVQNHAWIKIESSPMFIKILKYSDV